jgi:hypothetical protein
LLCALVAKDVCTIDEVVAITLELVYRKSRSETKLVVIANSLSADYFELEVQMRYEGTFIAEVDNEVQQKLAAIWFAMKLNAKSSMNLGSVGMDLLDEFGEIHGSESTFRFPIWVAGMSHLRRNRALEREERETEAMFNKVIEDPDVINELMDKMRSLNRSWR